MRKRITGTHHAKPAGERAEDWLDLEHIATVEVTSEDPGFPIECAVRLEDGPAGALLNRVNSRSASFSINLYHCIIFNFVS